MFFWLVFIIVIIFVFFINAETIQRNFGVFVTRLTAGTDLEEQLLLMDDDLVDESTLDVPVEIVIQPPRQPEPPPAPEPTPTPEPVVPDPPAPPEPVATPPVTPPVTPPPQPVTPITPDPVPVQTRDRVIYFTQVSSDGQILQSRVTRRLPVTQTPMQDVLNALLTGPTSEELNRGIINLIPHNTQMLSALVRGNTAFINFSEDFLFTTFGIEGYVAQLRQIVWTVTEFQNINDVQFLIEGRRMDYLGEGIWIGSPIGRMSF